MQHSPTPTWHEAEKQIQKEIDWLHNRIETFHKDEKSLTQEMGCKNCLLRRIGILIVSGSVETREITKNPSLKSFWLKKPEHQKQRKLPKIYHGGDWHRNTMKQIENHFLHLDYDVVREPNLHRGRADLGVYKKGDKDLLVEVGTTSLFKLWFNLEMMRNFIYLIVPNDDILIEFTRSGKNLKNNS